MKLDKLEGFGYHLTALMKITRPDVLGGYPVFDLIE